MRILAFLFVMCLLSVDVANAQFTDNFADGNFQLNPEWSGNVSKFEVNAANQLHLNAPAESSQAYLSTASAAIAEAEWQFYVEISVNPSSTNFSSVYLVSDHSALDAALQGYFVKVGGTNDEVSLFRQDGISEIKIIDGADGRVNTSSVQIWVKVNRDLIGNWTLSVRPISESGYIEEGSVFDDTYTQSSFSGVYCKYTSTRSSAFYFDEFQVTGSIVPDHTPPMVSTFRVVDQQRIHLTFTEPITVEDAILPTNYLLNNAHPSSVQYTNDTARLTFEQPLPNGVSVLLLLSSISDLSNNLIADTTLHILYFTPSPPEWQSIIINEFMADPTPSKLSLPNDSDAEFIELYNASLNPYDLQNWQINGKNLPSFILLPGSFAILCNTTFRDVFKNYGNVIIPNSWPSLSNSGTSLILKSPDGMLIDSLTYTTSDVGEGISTERIYTVKPCGFQRNYALSLHPNGGSPGERNSVHSDKADTQPPQIVNLIPLAYDSLLVQLDEKVIFLQPSNTSVYINEQPTTVQLTYFKADSSEILLTFDNPLSSGSAYQLSMLDVSDCEGNVASEIIYSFYLDLDPPQIAEVIIQDMAVLEVRFSEKLQKGSAEKKSNFMLSPQGLIPKKALLSEDSLKVTLEFSQSLSKDQLLLLQVFNIEDLYANSIPDDMPSSWEFFYRDDIDSLKVINAYQLALYLKNTPDDHKIEQENFLVDRSVGKPASVLIDTQNDKLLHLIFEKPFSENKTHSLSIQNLFKNDGQRLSTPLQRFFYDTKGPAIEKVVATSSTELTFYMNEDFDLSETFEVLINNTIASVVSYEVAGKALIVKLEKSLEQEVEITIGLAGLQDQQSNLSDPNQDFRFFYDQLPPRLDTAYFISPQEILLTFHEELNVESSPEPVTTYLYSPLNAEHYIRFIQLNKNKIILSIGLETPIQFIDFEINGLSDLNHNMIQSPIRISISNNDAQIGYIQPVSASAVEVQFTLPVHNLQPKAFRLESGISPDTLIQVSDHLIEIIFSEPFYEGGLYSLRYQEQSVEFLYQSFVESVMISGPSSLSIRWTTQIQSQYAERLESYLVNGKYAPTATVHIDEDQTTQLFFEQDFEKGILHSLTISDLYDIDGFRIPESEQYFGESSAPNYFELIISEIMADPSPVQGLLDAEYVEIFNASHRPLQLGGLQIYDQNQHSRLPAYWLSPGQYLTLCSHQDSQQLATLGPTLGLRSFPNMNASEDTISLINSEGRIIHSVAYDQTWYNHATKKNGGWSLEMVDTAYPCQGQNNWTASVNSKGGTPGKTNSVQAINPDISSPVLLQAVAEDSLRVRLDFDEKLLPIVNEVLFILVEDHSVLKTEMHQNQRSLNIVLAEPLIKRKTYQVVVEKIADCSGNTAQGLQTTSLVLPEQHEKNDILVSEILFHPRPGGVDFVEIYNHSDKHISLKNWKLKIENTSGTETSVISQEVMVIAPGQYLAFTDNLQTLLADYPVAKQGRFHEVANFPNLLADGGTLLLIDAHDNIVQRVPFDPDWHHPLLQEKRGVSLERVSWETQENNPQSWHSAASSAGFATPGYRNSQWMENHTVLEPLAVDPPVFFPDQSGYQNYTRISIAPDTPGTMINLKIYDARGRLIRNLAQNQSLGEEAHFIWDGTDDQHKRALNGYYIIWAETFDLKGSVKISQTKVAVGSRY